LGRHGRIEPGPEITPDEIRVRATVKRPDLLVVNQAFFPGWRAEGTVDGPLVPFRGLLALRLPAGRHELALRYRPWTVAVGAGVSLVGLGLAALWWIYRPGRDGIRRAHDERVRREPADHSGRGSS
ncbi:MAG TPA: hypothetical protein VLL48_14525, partial [Longimicrobiales bacterium]|nr:hypothetical protein [Longimicrobiales bacterium]